jgi:hypothetical protein
VYYAAKRHEAEEICGDIDIFALVQATKRQNLGTSITFDTILRKSLACRSLAFVLTRC